MSLCPLGTSPAVAPFVGGPERQNQSLCRGRKAGVAAVLRRPFFSYIFLSAVVPIIQGSTQGRSWLAPLPSSFIATSASSPTSTPARPRRPSGSSSTPASTTRWARSMTARRPWTGWSRSRSAASPSPRRRPRPSGGARPSSSRTAIASTSSTPRPRRLHHRGGRSLRVLDGAVVVFSGADGVEPQSETVWRQANKYHVPRLACVNKWIARAPISSAWSRRSSNAWAMSGADPVGDRRGENFSGQIDLVKMKAIYWNDADQGTSYREEEIPAGCGRWPSGGRTWSRPPPRPTTN